MPDPKESELVKRAKVAEELLSKETKRQKPKTGTEQYREETPKTPEELEAEGSTTKAAILRKLEEWANYPKTHRNTPEAHAARETNQKYIYGPIERVTEGRGKGIEEAAKKAAEALRSKGYDPNPYRLGEWQRETAQSLHERMGGQHKPVNPTEPDYFELDEPDPKAEVQERMREVQERLDSVRRAQEAARNPETKNWTREQWLKWTEATRK